MNKDNSETHKDYNDIHNKYERTLIYGRFFLRIPKYINRALRMLNNYQNNFKEIFLRLEKPLLFLSCSIVAHEVSEDYKKLKRAHKMTTKEKSLFLLDSLSWHSLASFYLPNFIIAKSVYYFVSFSRKFIVNPQLLKYSFLLFSVCYVYFMISPINHLATFIMDNSLRKVYDFNYFELIKEKTNTAQATHLLAKEKTQFAYPYLLYAHLPQAQALHNLRANHNYNRIFQDKL